MLKDLWSATYLGDTGFIWLAACAVYPELRWPLTLELGRHVTDENNALIKFCLSRLAPLPWFRQGEMPDWMRLALLEALSKEQERLVRRIVGEVLNFPATKADFSLDAVLQENKQSSGNDAWHDYVFLRFMDNRLAVRLPREWRKQLRQVRKQAIARFFQKTEQSLQAVYIKLLRPLTEEKEKFSGFISVPMLKPLLKKLLVLRDAHDRELIKIADVFGDPVQLARYYVQPKCQHHDPADSNYDDVRSEVCSPIFETINDFMDKEAVVRDGKTQMFILSDAGMGKTSLLMMLKLAHLTAFRPSGQECILLKLGEDTLDIVKKVENKKNAVLLLDALDEDPLAWGNIRQRLLELLEQTKNFRRVIISCRTQFFPDDGKELDPFGSPGRVAVGPFRCPIQFLSLFDDPQVEEYLRKRFPSRWYQSTPQRKKAASGREKASRILDKMEPLRFRPLLLAHIEDLVEAYEKDWNAYRIYGTLIDAWLRREEGKIRKLHKGAERLSDKKDLLKACVKVAEFMQRQGKKTITEPALQFLVTMADEHITYLRDFNISGRSLLNRNSSRAFRFSHYTIQEYLLAYGIVKGYLKDEPIRATEQMLLFLDLSRCKGMGLSRLELQELDLGKHFRKYNGDDFKGRNLRGANLAGSDLNGDFFEKADFRDA
ncbi:MAG: hypothetical protein GY862_10045, partial [Gammaproteobacteria bacterium]|nr:hypothetical protein [Gammaproteobacteria bacterium]